MWRWWCWSLAMAVVAGCGDDGAGGSGAQGEGEAGAQTSGEATGGTMSSGQTTDSGVDTVGGTGGGTTGAGTGPISACEAGWDSEDEEEKGDDGAEDETFGMGDDMPVSVYAIQTGGVGAGAAVVLDNVLVISPSATGEALEGTEFFVQDPDGGAYSGLQILATSDIAALATVGDTLELHGQVTSWNEHWILRVTQAEDLTVTGTDTPPPPPLVATEFLVPGTETARSYDGIVVRIEGATVTNPDPCDGEFVVDETLRVDDRFMPDALPTAVAGQVLDAVEGVLIFAEDSYEIAPPNPSGIG